MYNNDHMAVTLDPNSSGLTNGYGQTLGLNKFGLSTVVFGILFVRIRQK